MKLIWHIIKKDILREWRALALWSLFFLAQIGLGVFILHGGDGEKIFNSAAQKGAALLTGIQLIVAYVLVARMVQADALVGSRAFWLTRPISGTRLLFSKILGALLLFGLFPMLLLLPWWLYCAFGIQEILWASLEVLGWQVLVIAPAFLVASLTDDLGRVLLWTLLLVMGFFGWIVLMQSSMTIRLIGAQGDAVHGAVYTRVLISALISIVGSLAVTTHQFLTRRFFRSVICVAAGLGLIALISQTWRWDWSPYLAQFYESAHIKSALPSDLAKDVSLTMQSAEVNGAGRKNQREEEAMIRVTFNVTGIPAEFMVAGSDNSIETWSWPDGMTIAREVTFFRSNLSNVPFLKILSLPKFSDDPETMQELRGNRTKFTERRPGGGFFQPPFSSSTSETDRVPVQAYAYTSLPRSFIARMRKDPAIFSATMQCLLWSPDILVELPLQKDVRQSKSSMTFLVRQVRHTADSGSIQVVTTEPSLLRNGLWSSMVVRDRSVVRNQGQFLPVNRFLGSLQHITGNMTSASAQIGGVLITWNSVPITPDKVIRGNSWVIRDPDWFAHTTLVVYTGKPMAQFRRDVKTDKFELDPDRQTTKAQ